MDCQIPLRSGWPSKVRPLETAGVAAERPTAARTMANPAKQKALLMMRSFYRTMARITVVAAPEASDGPSRARAIMKQWGYFELSGRFWWLIVATFLGFLGFGSVLPQLAPHVRLDLGGSDRTVGFVIGTFCVVALCSRVIAGRLADRKGRKRAFLTGLSSCTLAGAAYLLPLGIGGIYLARVLQGFGEACLYTGAAAWAVEVAGVHRSARALGFLSSGIWGGFAAGPLIGQMLGSFQNAAIFQIFAALAAISLLSQVPEDYQPSSHPRRSGWMRRSLLAPGIAVGFVNVHYPVITGFLILYLARRGNAGPAAFSASAALVLFSRFFLGGLPDRVNPR